MNIYRISQYEFSGLDTYDSAVVAAESEEAAKQIHPSGHNESWGNCTWCHKPENVEVQLLGVAVEGTSEGVILASFNAG